MKKHIFLVAEDPSFGAAANVINAMYREGHYITALFQNKDPKGYWETIEINEKCIIYVDGDFNRKIPAPPREPDEIIIIGSSAWDMLFVEMDYVFDKSCELENCKVVLTDTYYIRNHKRLNYEFDSLGVAVYAMPDLYKYRTEYRVTYPFYQPFDIEKFKKKRQKKHKKYTICHSPGAKAKSNQKGTIQIGQAVEKYLAKNNLARYKLITDLDYEKCLEEKSKCHVFIDQMQPENPYDYAGGIGKSGLEAMLLGSLVLSCGEIVNHCSFPEAPVQIFNSEKELLTALEFFEEHPEIRKFIAKTQQVWAETFLSYSYVAERLIE